MGFEPQIRQILNQIRPDRQMTLWSATWEKELSGIARDYIKNPITVMVGSADLKANENIKQHFAIATQFQKPTILANHIRQNKNAKYLVFVSTKRGSEALAKYIWDNLGESYDFSVIHGDKAQMARNAILSDFKLGNLRLLISTDVCARGLDVKDIDWVVNYDFPNDVESYIHRIGRTGRAGKQGNSLTILTEQDYHFCPKLIQVLKDANQEVPEILKKNTVEAGK